MYCGDCIILCDDYVALKLNLQLILLTTDPPYMSLCSYPFKYGHLEVVKLLVINSKLDVDSKDKSGWIPLDLACL